MTERTKLLESIAATIQDYRAGEIPRPTPAHVDRWLRQFPEHSQLQLLREVQHVLTQTYFSRTGVSSFFANQITHESLTGGKPCAFWRSSHLLNIQKQGQSQADILSHFSEALQTACGVSVEQCGAPGGAYIYLDDALFSGSRIGNDLTSWIADKAPQEAVIHILVIASHRYGEWACSERLKKEAQKAQKTLTFTFWSAIKVENRMRDRDASEVLWPAVIPDDAAIAEYIAAEKKFPFQARGPGTMPKDPVFSSLEGRDVMERELLLAGMRIRAYCQNPSHVMRPLGFSSFGLGFGSMIVTYRNCPNNAPLALWWGDSEAAQGHPLSRWYPLLPRKTYRKELSFDELF